MQTVLLLFGGESSEHDVSIASATNVSRAINTENYKVLYGYIDRTGGWWSVDGIVQQKPDTARQLLPVMGSSSFQIDDSEEMLFPDVILPVLHGKNGEDGSVQALAQLLHIPVVGCDMTAGAVAMNKVITKQLAVINDIPVVPFATHFAVDGPVSYDDVAEKLGGTVFVKPANAGSSVGVSKASNQEELDAALTEAHKHDGLVLIERSINARELEVAVLGNYPVFRASSVGEIKADSEFYTYESKYDSSSTSEVLIPAPIEGEQTELLRSLAAKIFHVIGGSGLSRVDFFLDKDSGDIYLNEINTFPGFTDISMYPKLWEHAGVSYSDLIDQLIKLALENK